VNVLRLEGRVWLTEAVAVTIAESAERAHPDEAGGVLIGVLSRSRPWVTAAIEIPSAHASGSYYGLPEGSRRRVVSHHRQSDGRLGYLGEWHSHPSDVVPSRVDIDAMKRVARDLDACSPHPLLIVARRRDCAYTLDAREVRNARVRRVRLIAAGPLPPAGHDSESGTDLRWQPGGAHDYDLAPIR